LPLHLSLGVAFLCMEEYVKLIFLLFSAPQYLTKQTTALREVNDSRLRIYEQLEVSIQELERNNQRLLFDHTNDKKTIKT
jgi:hypothetical protein